ncbi:MAG TPA: hypothetical protein VFO44_07115 [Steroidobacteraceae bacterium]|nr:hypothetical protein [Steroidobacteraceae bacterium]
MSPSEEQIPAELERRLQGLLEESVAHVDGHIRSRLNQARQAAVAEVTPDRRPAFLRPFVLMPAAGALAAAVLVAFVLWPHSAQQVELPVTADAGHSMEDLDLLADGDGLDLVSAEEADGPFLEWAADQTDAGETST